MSFLVAVLGLLALTPLAHALEFDFLNPTFDPAEQWPAYELNCAHGYRQFDPLTQKKTYYVGVHATAGPETAWREFNLTFEEYLTRTVGARWNPPLEFKMKVSTDPLRDWVDNEEEVDFMYSDTGLYSCIGVEIGGQPLGTTISHLTVRGKSKNLDVYAGSIIVRADNKKLQSVTDLKDTVIAAQSISDFSGAQVQFYTMFKKGLNYIMDPKQVVFTENQDDIVRGVLNKDFEVGFVRTGMIERTKDISTGEFIDPDLFRVLDPKIYVMDTLDLFPFLHSTPVFPEWPLFAKQDVDRVVSEEVALAFINFEYHKIVGDAMHACKDEICDALGFSNSSGCTAADTHICDTAPPVFFDPTARCDTTSDLAELAYQAGIAGRHNGFRPARSHFDLRSMQQEAGFLLQDEDGHWHCPRSSTLYEAIRCPEGTYKVSKDEFGRQCEDAGLPCPEGYSCYCKPCIRAFEVDVLEWMNNGEYVQDGQSNTRTGCDKMTLCGTVEQTKDITFRAYDNRERVGAVVTAMMHVGQASHPLPVKEVGNGTFTYEFSYSDDYLGVGILEVYVDGDQIPESPFRVQVEERDCEADFPGHGKEATESGTCSCGSGTIDVRGDCMPLYVFASIIAVVVVFFLLQIGWCYWSYRRAKSDEMWQVSVEELHFGDPVEIVGEGAFGVVLLAEYRGTKVAIKRVLPLDGDRKRRTGSRSGSKLSGSNSGGAGGGSRDSMVASSGGYDSGSVDLEAAVKVSPKALANGGDSYDPGRSGSSDIDSELDFLGGLSFGHHRKGFTGWLAKKFPWMFPDALAHYNGNLLGTASGGHSKSTFQTVCPWLDENHRRQQDFMVEMRLLSRLRHPGITTVMGAVITRGQQPMMVMEYMENGSLYDLLRNETLYTGGEIIMQICRDVAQGLRFLHASKPPILHGDLKAKNILIDSRFRAKVADFGLSTKRRGNGITGTPFWLAPEYLRGKTEYGAPCDIYSFGIILFEIYGRKKPYEGENPRKVLRAVCDPRKNKRPPVPNTCPPKMVEVMKKCWSPDPFYRPHAKDLDMLFMDMQPIDAEPVQPEQHDYLQKRRTGDMLYEVFPKKVADQLKAGKKVEQETHENVTILFSDIVHFTNISQTMSPAKVCNMLDRLYLAFDELARKHEVFKVETIGDAYMGVTNLENNQDHDHVKRIAEFAIDAVEAAGNILIDEENPRKGYVRIRVGFHSGQVVSNVIGSLNPRFGLFGDTVNTASRMESNSISGKIHCSRQAAELLAEQAPEIPIWKRGKIGVKGKGEMVTFWVGLAPTKDKDPSERVTKVEFAEPSETQTRTATKASSMELPPNDTGAVVVAESSDVEAVAHPVDLLSDAGDVKAADGFLGDIFASKVDVKKHEGVKIILRRADSAPSA